MVAQRRNTGSTPTTPWNIHDRIRIHVGYPNIPNTTPHGTRCGYCGKVFYKTVDMQYHISMMECR